MRNTNKKKKKSMKNSKKKINCKKSHMNNGQIKQHPRGIGTTAIATIAATTTPTP
jgi:hypothetical protein